MRAALMYEAGDLHVEDVADPTTGQPECCLPTAPWPGCPSEDALKVLVRP
ncbi:hypothetical protein [Streptomyces sp. NPDC048590]